MSTNRTQKTAKMQRTCHSKPSWCALHQWFLNMIDVLKDAKDSKEKGKIKKGGLVFFLHFQHFYLNCWLPGTWSYHARRARRLVLRFSLQIYPGKYRWYCQRCRQWNWHFRPLPCSCRVTLEISCVELPKFADAEWGECVVCLSRLMILTFFAAKLIKNERRRGKKPWFCDFCCEGLSFYSWISNIGSECWCS